MKIKNWLIKKLGGITIDDQEEIRSNYEKWAVKHLSGKNGETTPDFSIYYPKYRESILVTRSNIHITGGVTKSILISPWCKKVTIEGVMVSEEIDKVKSL